MEEISASETKSTETKSTETRPSETTMTTSETPDASLKGVVGIQNMGNTCYCNSTLQLIRACPEWNAFCLTQDFIEQLKNVPEDNASKRILLAYQDILKSLWSAYKPAYVRPLGFISEVRKAVKGTVYEMLDRKSVV